MIAPMRLMRKGTRDEKETSSVGSGGGGAVIVRPSSEKNRYCSYERRFEDAGNNTYPVILKGRIIRGLWETSKSCH